MELTIINNESNIIINNLLHQISNNTHFLTTITYLYLQINQIIFKKNEI